MKAMYFCDIIELYLRDGFVPFRICKFSTVCIVKFAVNHITRELILWFSVIFPRAFSTMANLLISLLRNTKKKLGILDITQCFLSVHQRKCRFL